MEKEEKHLPVIGVGPLSVAPQLILIGIAIWMDKRKLIPNITSKGNISVYIRWEKNMQNDTRTSAEKINDWLNECMEQSGTCFLTTVDR